MPDEPTTYTTGFMQSMPPATEAGVVVEQAQQAAEPRPVDAGGLVVLGSPQARIVDLETYDDVPRRKRGTVTFYTADSFARYVNRHTETQAIYADVEQRRLVALLNDHDDETAGWGDHRAILALRHPPAWQRWLRRDGQLGNQIDFAEHIEDSLNEILEPDGATMLELAQSISATRNVAFRSDQRLANGQVQVRYEETIDARAGATGHLEIPTRFLVALAPFEGADPYRIEARLRYRLRDGQLAIGYQLHRVNDVLEQAFDDIIEQVETSVEFSVYRGTPRS